MERVEAVHSKGIFIYLQGEKYPVRGLPTPEALIAVNTAKRTFISTVRLLTSPFFLPSLFLGMIFYRSFIQKLVDTYRGIVKPILKPLTLKPEYRWPGTNELSEMGHTFLLELGIEDGVATKFSHIFEYDSAYRLRLVDIMSATSKEQLLSRPIREIRRLIKLEQSRDYDEVGKKFSAAGDLLCLILLHPALRRAFRTTIKQADLSKLVYDEGDRYWALKGTDYNAFGLNFEERQKLLEQYI